MDKRFKTLENKRRQFTKSLRDNNFNFQDILSGAYQDASHFIDEILQNADDAGAKWIKFYLKNNELKIIHNGRVFNFKDVDAITGIGITTKADEINTIGKFGVGFKSVFAITQSPEILSGKYHFRIHDFIIPSPLETDFKCSDTRIILPFKHTFRTQGQIYNLVQNRIKSLNAFSVLFLQNVTTIEWNIRGNAWFLNKSEQKARNSTDVRFVKIKSANKIEKYLVFDKSITISEKEKYIKIALKLDSSIAGKKHFIPEKKSPLFAFLPTEQETLLNFILQGPYRTTPNRENVPLELDENSYIFKETCKLLALALEKLKYMGYLNKSIWSVLPINPELATRNHIYSILFDFVKEQLTCKELIPVQNKKHFRAKDLVVIKQRQLKNLLQAGDLEILFSKKNYLYLDRQMKNYHLLLSYFKDHLNIISLDFYKFVTRIEHSYLKNKTDKWMLKFYTELLAFPGLWQGNERKARNKLMTSPLFRLETGEHESAFDQKGEALVFLPTPHSDQYKTIKKSLCRGSALQFFKAFGIQPPDFYQHVVKTVLPKYIDTTPKVTDKEYLRDLEQCAQLYQLLSNEMRRRYIYKLSDYYFIKAVQSHHKTEKYLRPENVYFYDYDISEYFGENKSIYYPSDDILNINSVGIMSFLHDIGVRDFPRRIDIRPKLSHEQKYVIRGKNYNIEREIYTRDYTLEGLDRFMGRLDREKSILLWGLLSRCVRDKSFREAERFFQGEYSWYYVSKKIGYFESHFLRVLKNTEWLMDTNGILRRPGEVNFEELNGYEYNPVLISVLGMQSELSNGLSGETKYKLELVKDIPVKELELLIRNRNVQE